MKKNFKSYKDYLKSDKWDQVKCDYEQNEQVEECLCCGVHLDETSKKNFHHFKYPKDWNNDTWENLIVVCQNCHSEIHEAIEHDSDDISLRKYLLKLNRVSKAIAQTHKSRQIMNLIWDECGGDFAVKQIGISSSKSIEIKFSSTDKILISFFEKYRDDQLMDEF